MLIMKFYFFYFLSVFKGEDWYKVMLANLKFQGCEAVKNKDYLSAEEIYTKVLFAFHLFNLSCVFPCLPSLSTFLTRTTENT